MREVMDKRDFLKTSTAFIAAALWGLPIPASAGVGIPENQKLIVEKWFKGIPLPLSQTLPGSAHSYWVHYQGWQRIEFIELRKGDIFRLFNPNGTPHFDDFPWSQKIFHWKCERDAFLNEGGIPAVSTAAIIEVAPGQFETVE